MWRALRDRWRLFLYRLTRGRFGTRHAPPKSIEEWSRFLAEMDRELGLAVRRATHLIYFQERAIRRSVQPRSNTLFRDFDDAERKLRADIEQTLRSRPSGSPSRAARAAAEVELTRMLTAISTILRDTEKSRDVCALQALKWRHRAEMALFAGDEDLARTALRRRRELVLFYRRHVIEARVQSATLGELRGFIEALGLPISPSPD